MAAVAFKRGGGAVVGGSEGCFRSKNFMGLSRLSTTDGFPGDLNGIPVLEA